MNSLFRRLALVAPLALVVPFALIVLVGQALAVVDVKMGMDLLESLPGTTFGGAPFGGVPLGTFDFGGVIGTKPVGLTDTIVRRNTDAVPGAVPGSSSIPTELVALQLESIAPVNFGLGLDFYFVTLQSVRGGPASGGRMTINFEDAAGGTFSSFFDVFFDIRKGALDGPIALSDTLRLTNDGTPWNRIPPPGAVVIDGANHNLNGLDMASDFWPIGVFQETHPTGAVHVVTTGRTPEPTSLVLLVCGALGLATAARARRR